MESAVSDIQLFGSPSQIQTLHALLPEYRKTGRLPLDPLLNDIRNSLRHELDLLPIGQNVEWLRMEGAPQLKDSQSSEPSNLR